MHPRRRVAFEAGNSSLAEETMHETGNARRRRARAVVMAVVALGALVGLGGCVSISPRVWQNGQNISSFDVVYGPRDLRSHDHLYRTADPLLLWHQSVPYPGLGTWSW